MLELTKEQRENQKKMAKERELNWRRASFWRRVNSARFFSGMFLVTVSGLVVSFFLGEADLVARLGAVLVACGVVAQLQITSKVRQDNLTAIFETLRTQARNDANFEARELIRAHVKSEALERPINQGSGDTFTGLIEKLNLYEFRPSTLEYSLILLGTIVWGFGDFFTCWIWGDWSKC
jgi:hypothetical protein